MKQITEKRVWKWMIFAFLYSMFSRQRGKQFLYKGREMHTSVIHREKVYLVIVWIPLDLYHL